MSKSGDSSRFWGEGDHPLESGEQAKVSSALGAEPMVAFARGRTNGKRHLWVLSATRLVSVGMGWFGQTATWPLSSVSALEQEEGSHGMTLRAMAGGGRQHLIAIAPEMSRAFATAVEKATGLTATFIPSKKVVRRADDMRESVAPLHFPPPEPTAPAPARTADVMAELERAASLRASGVLSDAEFAELKHKILNGAS